MNLKSTILFSVYVFLIARELPAQVKYSRVNVDTQLKDTFSFDQEWDYAWDVFKDDSTGEFIKASDQPLTAADTTHLFFTAKCSTNVQGGYDIRYCYAKKESSDIVLTFSDGLPAYASEYYVYIKGDSFSFRPKTIYPAFTRGQKISYRITKQKLVLNRNAYSPGDIIIGYIDIGFLEIVSAPGHKTEQHPLYLRGYIKTLLKNSNNRDTP
ncbi:MAG TPA: hypothetical protein VFI06_08290 [Chitinophagaceae bacterium]|nr:hypothetical protein [Chitinophagaceae bacterium]